MPDELDFNEGDINKGQPGDTGETLLEGMPPVVRNWIIENFQAFRIDGFDMTGKSFEYVHFDNQMGKWALYEAARRSIAWNDASVRVHIESSDVDFLN